MARTLADEPALRPVTTFDGARAAGGPTERLAEVRRRAQRFREEALAAPRVRYLRSFPLVRVPYPTRYALRDAFHRPTPFTHLVNRMFVVQVDSPDGVKTVLVSPSDVDGNKETPFFKRLAERFGPFQALGERLIAPRLGSVEEALAAAGIRPEDVDYITYDHLHTQDLRRWLGTDGAPGALPRARLLVMRQEWESARALLPIQADWYCPDGTAGVDEDRVVLLDGDVAVGDGLYLVATPGHTEGNHSIVTHADEGLFVTSENGVAPECWEPRASRIPGLRRYARDTGAEVVMNANTLEGAVDQYLSMVQEKTIAGPSARDPAFPNLLCSSEMASYWAFPGLAPTFSFGDVAFGAPVRAGARGDRAAA